MGAESDFLGDQYSLGNPWLACRQIARQGSDKKGGAADHVKTTQRWTLVKGRSFVFGIVALLSESNLRKASRVSSTSLVLSPTLIFSSRGTHLLRVLKTSC